MKAISVEDVSKKFKLSHRQSGSLVRSVWDLIRHGREEFWALKDITFDVNQGEAFGIIGRNGAGKSTILKLLSNIMQPTNGRIRSRGRISSLIEVGAGFHPDMTGRENIYLNGSILGMTRSEIDRKYDEIVAFAELEKFVDTPVKRYSSGMYARLGFAVAAYVDPEILIVDEVLSVGDTGFQARCISRMNDVYKQGSTVIFVSHNLNLVTRLCQRAMLLEKGHVAFLGPAQSAVKAYSKAIQSNTGQVTLHDTHTPVSDSEGSILSAYTTRSDGSACSSFFIGETIVINAVVKAGSSLRKVQMSFIVRNDLGTGVLHCMSQDDLPYLDISGGLAKISATIPEICLYPGEYVLDEIWLATSTGETLDCTGPCLRFTVAEGGPFIKRSLAKHAALIYEPTFWQVESQVETSVDDNTAATA